MSCQHSNPSNHLFCRECGEKLKRRMCSCGQVDELDAKFCGKCRQVFNTVLDTDDVSETVHHIYKYNLNVLLDEVSLENVTEQAPTYHLTQSDIQALIMKQRNNQDSN